MILQYFAVGLLTLAAAVIQSTLLRFMSDDFALDLVFVIVLMIGLYKDPVHGAIMSAAAGYLQDLMVTDIPGFHMTARMVVFFAAQYTRSRLSPDTPLSQFMIGLGIGLLDRLTLYFLHQVFLDPLPFAARDLGSLLMGVLINAALCPIFYFLFRAIPGFMELPGGPRVQG